MDKDNEKIEIAENTDGDSEKSKTENKKITFKSLVDDFLEIVETVFVMLLCFLLIRQYICDEAIVEGDSMYPTFEDTQKVIYCKVYNLQDNDIVIADNDRIGPIIKRVIATEGQTVDIKDGFVYVDGVQLDEQIYVEGEELEASHFITSLTYPRTAEHVPNGYPVTVPENCIFVLGDNRKISEDSRGDTIGFINEDNVLGKVICRYEPFEEFKFF